MKTFNLTAMIVLFALSALIGQSNLKIGEWKSHLPFQVAHNITQDEVKIYFTTESTLYTINKDDGQTDFFSKIDGLTDIGSNILEYDKYNDVLLMVYGNSNLDIISEEDIVNLPFILTSQAVGDKQVYDVYIDSDTVAYMAMGFGLKVLNVKDVEFGDEVKAGIKFNSVTVFEGYIYVATDEGIYRISQTEAINIQDFGEWEWLGTSAGFPAAYRSDHLVVFEDKLYMNIDTTLTSYDGSSLNSIYEEESLNVRFLSAEGQRLIVGWTCCIPNSKCACDAICNDNCEGKVLYVDSDGSYTEAKDICTDRPIYAMEDEKGQIWFADGWRGLRRASGYDAECEKITYNSPLTTAVTDIEIVNNTVLVATQQSGRDPQFIGDGYFQLKDGEWTNYNNQHSAILSNLSACVEVAINPSNGNAYIGTLWDGMIEMVDGVPTTSYNEDLNNSPLKSAIGDSSRVRVTGLAFDKDGNLWVANHATLEPICVLQPNGEWFNSFVPIPEQGLRFLTIDGFGYKWFSVDGSAQGLLVYDDAGTLTDSLDDKWKRFSSNNSELPNNTIFSLATDLDGDVWVGTNEGIVIFECGGNVFDPNNSCQGSRRVVDVGGFNSYLLESQEVRAIAVDGANRKWVGTNNGVFVLSPDGRDQLAFFDKDNSPLFANRINGIAVNQETGEVFIGTSAGLISYQSDAQQGGFVNSQNAYAYPNPVKPNYDGPIAIKGLARDANVKITDINGRLVYESKSFGGQAIWNGKDYNGRKVSSGVYLVFSTSTQSVENPDAIVTKILVIN